MRLKRSVEPRPRRASGVCGRKYECNQKWLEASEQESDMI